MTACYRPKNDTGWIDLLHELAGFPRRHVPGVSGRQPKPSPPGGGDYVLALKANQGRLHDDTRLYLDDPAPHRRPAPYRSQRSESRHAQTRQKCFSSLLGSDQSGSRINPSKVRRVGK